MEQAGQPQPGNDDYWETRTVGRRAFRGGFAGALGLGVSIVVTFLVTPYILDKIGPAGYGLFVLVNSLVAYGAILDLGIGGALVKLVAEYRAKGDTSGAGSVVATALRVYTLLALVCLMLTGLVAALLPGLFNLAGESARTGQIVALLMGANLALSIFATPPMSVMAGIQRYDVQNLVGTAGVIANALATVATLAAGWGLIGMVAANLPITLAMRGVSSWYVSRQAPELAMHWGGASRAIARRMLGLSSAIFLAQLSGPLQKKTDEIVIGAIITVTSITPYALARKLSEVAHQVSAQFIRVLLPIASGFDALSQPHRLRELYVAATRATLAIFMSMTVVLIVYADLILTAWVGAEYASAASLVIILSLASVALTSSYPAGSILQGIGRFRLIAVSSLISGLANLALSIYLAANVGVVGVAVGTLIPTTAEALLVVTPYSMHVLGVSLRDLMFRVWGPIAIATLPAAAVMLLLRATFDLTNLVTLIPAAAVGGGTYLLAYFAFPQTAREREVVLDVARRALARPLRALGAMR